MQPPILAGSSLEALSREYKAGHADRGASNVRVSEHVRYFSAK